MTSKEALIDLKKRNKALKEEGHFHIGVKVMSVIEDLVEKDTPMKVINGTTINEACLEYECPRCKQEIDNGRYSKDQYYLIKHCISCGQKLDWSDDV